MTISIKGGSGLIWAQDSEVKVDGISSVTSSTYVSVLNINQETLATNIYITVSQNTTGSMRVTKNGVVLGEISLSGGASSSATRSFVGQYVNGVLTGTTIDDVYQPPSPPLHCVSSLLVEIKRDSGSGTIGATVEYTTGTFEPI